MIAIAVESTGQDGAGLDKTKCTQQQEVIRKVKVIDENYREMTCLTQT